MTVATRRCRPLQGGYSTPRAILTGSVQPPTERESGVTDQSTIQQVDPRTLLVDRNIRHQLGIEPEFVASIREDGVLQPITVVRTQAGDYRVRFGHRRTAAAIEAELETVPVIVRGDEYPDDGTEIDRLVGQWAENEQRAGLTNAERVETINQLAAFGVSAHQIAKQTKAKRVHVDAALKINESELARKSTARWDWLDLEQLAVIAEFDDDPEAVKTLVTAAQRGQFTHAAQRLRDERAEKEAMAAAAKPLLDAGIRVLLDGRRQMNWEADSTLDYLVDPAGNPVDEQTHQECPGHAVFLEFGEEWFDHDAVPEGWTVQPADPDDEDDTEEGAIPQVYATGLVAQAICQDYRKRGHHPKYGTRSAGRSATPAPLPADATDEQRAEAEKAAAEAREAASAERRDVIKSNKEWKSAETVRKEWVKSFLTRKTLPKGAAQYVAGEYASAGHELRTGMEKNHEVALGLLGVPYGVAYRDGVTKLRELIAEATEARAQVITLGLILGAQEGATSVMSWRSVNPGTARYLLLLEANGYPLSNVERRASGKDPIPEADD